MPPRTTIIPELASVLTCNPEDPILSEIHLYAQEQALECVGKNMEQITFVARILMEGVTTTGLPESVTERRRFLERAKLQIRTNVTRVMMQGKQEAESTKFKGWHSGKSFTTPFDRRL